jgi:hypothetical protein
VLARGIGVVIFAACHVEPAALPVIREPVRLCRLHVAAGLAGSPLQRSRQSDLWSEAGIAMQRSGKQTAVVHLEVCPSPGRPPLAHAVVKSSNLADIDKLVTAHVGELVDPDDIVESCRTMAFIVQVDCPAEQVLL